MMLNDEINASKNSSGLTPVVIIGGAPKSGTSAVFKYLSDHKSINPSRVKETAFFIDENITDVQQSKNNYESFFQGIGTEKIKLEASTGYLGYADVVIPKVKKILGENVKFIFILRNPSDRIYSYYCYRRGNNAFPPSLSFTDYIHACIAYDKNESNEFGLEPYDLKILSHGKYSEALRKYIEEFGRSSILIMPYERLSKEPYAFMKEVSSFIGLDDEIYQNYTFTKYNVTKTARFHLLHNLALQVNRKLEPSFRRYSFIKRIMKKIYQFVNISKVGYAYMSASDNELLNDYYNKSLKDLEAITEKNIFGKV